jgi:hypothetical protein
LKYSFGFCQFGEKTSSSFSFLVLSNIDLSVSKKKIVFFLDLKTVSTTCLCLI